LVSARGETHVHVAVTVEVLGAGQLSRGRGSEGEQGEDAHHSNGFGRLSTVGGADDEGRGRAAVEKFFVSGLAFGRPRRASPQKLDSLMERIFDL
jgi:hypothetical protein